MNIYLDTIGCRLNQGEIETYARQFRAAGHDLVADPAQADLAVINTCTVTAAAAADSRKKIRLMARLGVPQVVVTGCWSSLEPQAAAALPGVAAVIPNLEKDNLVPLVLDLPAEDFELESIQRLPIPGARARTRAFIKVQDGCDNRCTFCITSLARGAGRSRSIPAVLADIQAASAGGTQEIVLTGVHMGSWGRDLPGSPGLGALIQTILAQSNVPRLRLSSLEPWDIAPDFFELWEDARLARHLHLPLQSGCAATLKRMARKTTPQAYAQILADARQAIPGIAITTDLIVGFPDESGDEFRQSLDFVSNMGFARGHVFTYSERPGTAAARMPNPVPYPERKARNAEMRAACQRMEAAYRQDFVEAQLEVLWERARELGQDTWELNGLSDNYLRVTALAPAPRWNRIDLVRVTAVTGDGVRGEILI
jgi:threonylcarbamoyladenosine tRNA methylthiotransferase MtaB